MCRRCAGSHSSKDCTEPISKCTNCTYFNNKLNCSFDTQHDAADGNCAVYKRKLDIFRQKIDYSVASVN